MGQSAIERLAEETKDQSFGTFKSKGKNDFRLKEQFEMMDFSDGEWKRVRLLPGQWAVAEHWLGIKGKDKDTGKKYKSSKRLLAHNIDIETGAIDSTMPPDLVYKYREHFHSSKWVEGSTGFNTGVFFACIDRDAQRKQPKKIKDFTKDEKKTGFKDPESKSWTPVKGMRLPKGALITLEGIQKLNIQKHKGEKREHKLSDPKYGMDIMIRFDGKADASKMWQIQPATGKKAQNSLSSEEMGYLVPNIKGAILKDREAQPLEQINAWVEKYLKEKGIEMAKEVKGDKKSKKDKGGKSEELDETKGKKSKKDKGGDKGGKSDDGGKKSKKDKDLGLDVDSKKGDKKSKKDKKSDDDSGKKSKKDKGGKEEAGSKSDKKDKKSKGDKSDDKKSGKKDKSDDGGKKSKKDKGGDDKSDKKSGKKDKDKDGGKSKKDDKGGKKKKKNDDVPF